MKDCTMLWDSMWECGTMVRAYKAKYFRRFYTARLACVMERVQSEGWEEEDCDLLPSCVPCLPRRRTQCWGMSRGQEGWSAPEVIELVAHYRG